MLSDVCGFVVCCVVCVCCLLFGVLCTLRFVFCRVALCLMFDVIRVLRIVCCGLRVADCVLVVDCCLFVG